MAASTGSLVIGGLLADMADEPLPRASLRIVAILWIVGLHMVGLTRQRNASRPRVEATRGVLTALACLVALALLGDVLGPVSLRSPVIVLTTLFVGWFATRALVRTVLGILREQGHLARGVAIATSRRYLDDLVDLLQTPSQSGYRVVAAVPVDPTGDAASICDHIVSVTQRSGASGIVISPTGIEPALFHQLVHNLSPRGVHVEIQLPVRLLGEHRLKVTRLGRGFSLFLKPPRHSLMQRAAKRGVDILAAIVGLVLLSPVLAAIAVAVLFTKGPVFFIQERVGRGGKPFGMVKFRSMVLDAEDRRAELMAHNRAMGPLFKIPNDPRITRVGRWLRRTSLDEVPQLWNVLRGDMSLVGPRPALASEMADWPPELQERLEVAPGMTGMWQVYRSNDDYGDDYARLDLHYVRNWTLANDFGLILRTIPALFTSNGEK